jgi:hypothetical protein
MKHISTYIEHRHRATRRANRWGLALAAAGGLMIGLAFGIFHF